jgi:hypothetical protein
VVDAGEQVLAGAVALIEPLLAGHVAEAVGAQFAGGTLVAAGAAVQAGWCRCRRTLAGALGR